MQNLAMADQLSHLLWGEGYKFELGGGTSALIDTNKKCTQNNEVRYIKVLFQMLINDLQ